MSLGRDLFKQLEELGFVHLRTGKHHVFRHPRAGNYVCSVSPSDNRAVKNAISVAKRLIRRADAVGNIT